MKPFLLERYFDKYEFNSKYLLSSSDCEPLTVRELFSLADRDIGELFDISLGYTTSKGSYELRESISSLYDSISFENVFTLAGAQEAVYVFCRSMLLSQDEVIVQFPCYQSLYQVPEEIGCKVKFLEMQPDRDWNLDIEKLKNLITDKTKCIILNSPNNPTGYTIPNTFLKEIIEIAQKSGIYILCDEVYRFLKLGHQENPTSICDLYENGVSVGVMSKAFGLPGLRLGWLATKNQKVIKSVSNYKDYTSLCNNIFGEKLTHLALSCKEKILDRNISIITENIGYLNNFLKKNNSIFTGKLPNFGSVVFIKANLKESVEQFCEKAHKTKSVFILPSSVFSYPQKYIRIGLGRKNFREAIGKLDEFIDEL